MRDIKDRYSLFRRDIGRMASYILGSSDYSEDVIQEVFLELLKNKNNFKEKSSFKTYILAITRNVAKSYIKKIVKEKKIFERGVGEFTEADKTGSRDEKIILNMALKKIKSKYREPLLLKEMEGFSYLEISEIMNINIGTVRSRISTAKSRLLTFLNSENKVRR